ncbi:cytochrome P450 [Panaeolus papilionaceus]|nr:cytochrome P450 [Panaeolus papilionaceus]
MIQLLLECVAIYISYRVLWKVLRPTSDLGRVPGPPPESFLKGVFPRLFDVNGWGYHRMLRETYGGVFNAKGVLGENLLYTFDPKVLHHILVKDQNVFRKANINILSTRLIFGKGLLGTVGDHHKKQRKSLNPVFSIAHMRQMVPMFYEITHKLETSLVNQVKGGEKELDMAFWMGRTALELIGQSGFGHSFDNLSETYNEHDYSTAIKKMVPAFSRLSFLRQYFLKPILKIGTPEFRRRMIDFSPIQSIKMMRDVVYVMHDTSLKIYQSKKQALLEGNQAVAEQVGKGKDILSILMKQNMEASEEDRLDEEEIYAQISTFTFAGMDTTSNALCRTLWLLSQNKAAQTRLRQEVREAIAKKGGDIEYDDLVSLPYLDEVCRETLRIHTPVPHIVREPTEDIILPLSQPITLNDGRVTSEILVPKGTTCLLSLLGSNVNVELWGDDANEWKPDRWLNPLPEKVIEAHLPGIYSHLMTFAAGGHACIGFKFSQLEMKVVLAILVSRFEFRLSQEILWQMTGVVVPVLANGDHTKPSMPLMVRLVA